jgi:hypothetical protein
LEAASQFLQDASNIKTDVTEECLSIDTGALEHPKPHEDRGPGSRLRKKPHRFSGLKHDPEKCVAVFGKDHAKSKN